MVILGIESSCDDTSIALVEAVETPPQPSPLESLGTGSTRGGSFRVLAEKTASQIDIHKKYGGVVPEVAARMHAEAIVPVIEEVISSYIKQSASSLASAIAETTLTLPYEGRDLSNFQARCNRGDIGTRAHYEFNSWGRGGQNIIVSVGCATCGCEPY